jgi:hypothetical protein
MMGKQAIGGGYDIICNFKGTRFNIDRGNFAVIKVLNLRLYLSFIDLVATSSEVFFAVARMWNCQWIYWS